MRNWIAVGLTIALAGCATSAPPTFDTRQLSAVEKETLRKALSQTMKDPDAAQFKWLPAVVPQAISTPDEPIGYCGLVNGKNSFGGYIGYRRFFALLTRNGKGEYVGGTIKHIAGRPTTFLGNDDVNDAVANGLTEGSCQRWGYVDFAQAM